MTEPRSPEPPDVDRRRQIETALDTTMLAEAAAGTGKTTSLIGRMVALLREGKCPIGTMAAVTFTRKATAELRARFQIALESAVGDATGERRARLSDAIDHVEQCFIGTIHSFCARLLRERPVEARVDVAFEEIDEDAEFRLRMAAWDRFLAKLYADHDPLLAELDDLGLELRDLRDAYREFADYPDVETWPAEPVTLDADAVDAARAALGECCKHTETLREALARTRDRDRLMDLYLELPRRIRNARLGRTRELLDILEDCLAVKPDRVKVTKWPQGREQGRQERARWERFIDEHARPLVERRRRQRYEPALRVLKGAVAEYDRMRAERGVLSYQDLLMKAAALLRDQPHIRRYFRRRFTHLLVDEFQDTDPIQAEVMLLLTAADPQQQDWRECRPVAGALFVVGDPKQSIYRFRRADIVTYNQVRQIIAACGRIVELTANFRSIEPLVTWVNGVSENLFPQASDYAPADRPMEAAWPGTFEPERTAVRRLAVPAACDRKDEVVEYEAEAIARAVRDALDRRVAVGRAPRELDAGVPPYAIPGDFLVLTWTREPLIAYAKRLEAYGIPVEVTGGTAVNEVDEVALLHTALAAVVEADNPVALVGALRSPLFGVSDTELYRFSEGGGVFNYHRAGAAEIDGAEHIAEALGRLGRYAGWISRMQPVAAVQRIAGDLGLLARAVSAPGGADRAGALCKAIELLREAQREQWTVAALVEYLGALIDPDTWPPERHDGVPVRPHDGSAVRVMNLHQAKGLEARVVFLAEGKSGGSSRRASMHVDRRHGRVSGYLRVLGPKRGKYGSRPVLAEPPGWEAHEREEQRFLDAERNRLLYVAATRAAAELVVSRPEGGKCRWEMLAAAAEHCEPLPERPPPTAPPRETERLDDDAPRDFETSLRDRWEALARKTYDVQGVKALAVRGRVKVAPAGEHGTEWGSVVHVVLEAAMARPGSDSLAVARSALAEEGIEVARAEEVVALVGNAMRSAVWGRAESSPERLTEVPFQLLRPGADEVDTIVRGVIDLVFREGDGWVVVDYKTLDRPGASLDDLVEHYAPQVRAYAEAWARLTGEPVREAGLLFVNSGAYRVVSAVSSAP